MSRVQTIKEVMDKIIDPNASELRNAVVLHDYVRENVKFGFNPYFDASTPDFTLAFGYGHCNPKGRLMLTLFRELGLEAYQHFVAIPKEILKGAIPAYMFWIIPAEVSHSYIEVQVDGVLCEIDSFIVDTALLKGGLARLAREGKSMGYGVRLGSVNEWDGKSSLFSQFDSTLLIEDHGRVEDLDDYFRDRRYRNIVLGVSFNQTFKLMGQAGVAGINANIERIRSS